MMREKEKFSKCLREHTLTGRPRGRGTCDPGKGKAEAASGPTAMAPGDADIPKTPVSDVDDNVVDAASDEFFLSGGRIFIVPDARLSSTCGP